jgi:flagellar motor switch protein FliG
MKLPDLELSEVLAETPGRFVGFAIHKASEEVKNRFLAKANPRTGAEIKEYLEMPNVTLAQIGGGQMKMIETTRKLEKKGLIKTKRVPL